MVVALTTQLDAKLLSTPGRNYGDVFTAEGAHVFGQDRRDIVMSISELGLLLISAQEKDEVKRKVKEFREQPIYPVILSKRALLPSQYVILLVKRWTKPKGLYHLELFRLHRYWHNAGGKTITDRFPGQPHLVALVT